MTCGRQSLYTGDRGQVGHLNRKATINPRTYATLCPQPRENLRARIKPAGGGAQTALRSFSTSKNGGNRAKMQTSTSFPTIPTAPLDRRSLAKLLVERPIFTRRLVNRDGTVDEFEVEQLKRFLSGLNDRNGERNAQLHIVRLISEHRFALAGGVDEPIMMVDLLQAREPNLAARTPQSRIAPKLTQASAPPPQATPPMSASKATPPTAAKPAAPQTRVAEKHSQASAPLPKSPQPPTAAKPPAPQPRIAKKPPQTNAPLPKATQPPTAPKPGAPPQSRIAPKSPLRPATPKPPQAGAPLPKAPQPPAAPKTQQPLVAPRAPQTNISPRAQSPQTNIATETSSVGFSTQETRLTHSAPSLPSQSSPATSRNAHETTNSVKQLRALIAANSSAPVPV